MGYEFFPANHGEYKRSEVSKEGLEDILEYHRTSREVKVDAFGSTQTEELPNMREDDMINILLVAAGYKEGALANIWADSREEVHDVVETLNNMGVNIGVGEAEHGSGFYDPDGIYVGLRLSRQEDDADVYNTLDSHEEKGAFLGFPERESRAYEEHGPGVEGYAMNEDGTKEWNFTADSGKEHVYPVEALREKYGLADEDVDTLDLINYYVLDDEESVEQAKRTAQLRKRALNAIEEAYGVDLPE